MRSIQVMRDLKAYYVTPTATVKAVDGVNLDIREGEILGIAGESGCGKSTLVKVMYGYLQKPLTITGGTIETSVNGEGGKPVTVAADNMRSIWWKGMSYIPQGSMSVLNPVVRIEKQFFDAVPKGDPRSRDRRALRELLVQYLRELDLPATVLQAYPHQLSGGMRQRVIVALATFLHPQLVLADEPTTALDVVVQRGILGMLMRLQRKMNNTIVVVSHDMGVHYQITHRMAIMYAGQIVELGSTDEVFNNPRHPYTAMLIRSLPRVGEHGAREGIPGAPPSLINPPAGCRFAERCPHAAALCREQAPRLTEIDGNHQVACHLATGALGEGVAL